MRFFCHLHKPGVLDPEVHVVATASPAADDDALTDAIRLAMPGWPAFERIDIYDELRRPVCRVNYDVPVSVH